MRYPTKRKKRPTVVAALLLVTIAALAVAVAAHAKLSSSSRGDVVLRVPGAEKSAAAALPAPGRTTAPLFTRSSAGSSPSRSSEANALAGVLADSRVGARSFDVRTESRRTDSSRYRDYAGDRRRNGSNGGGGGSRAFGSSAAFGASAWGGVSGTSRAPREVGDRANRATRPVNNGQRNRGTGNSNASGASAGSGSNDAGAAAGIGGVVAGGVVAGAGTIISAGPVGSAPGPAAAPEPLTLLLVGSGLVGLYSARRHLA